jgi:hypothetical protein
MLATLERAFWAIVEAQAKRRGRENVTAFGAEVAKTVLSAGLLAVEDRGLGHPQYHARRPSPERRESAEDWPEKAGAAAWSDHTSMARR